NQGPLVHHPKAFHQDGFRSQGADRLCVQLHLPRLELVRSALPAEELVEGLGCLELTHLRQLFRGYHSARNENIPDPLEGALLHFQRLLELLLGDDLRAHQEVSEKVLLLLERAFDLDDVAVLESERHLRVLRLQDQRSALLLLSDELEDVGDPEVFERSPEGHGLGLLLVEAAQRQEVHGDQRCGQRGKPDEQRLGAVRVSHHAVPKNDVEQCEQKEKGVERAADRQPGEDMSRSRAEQSEDVGQLVRARAKLRNLDLLANLHRGLHHVLARKHVDALLAQSAADAELGIAAPANGAAATQAGLRRLRPAQRRTQTAEGKNDRDRIKPGNRGINIAQKLKRELRLDFHVAIALV